MGLITIILVVWLHFAEERAWLRRLGWWALGAVLVQGYIGGRRVQLDAMHVPGFEMSLGQMLRIPHGILAQVYVCLLFAIAAGLSRTWIENHGGASALPSTRVRRIGWLCLALLFVQLTVATSMRHNFAGMAIPTFPLSTADGSLLPATWDYRVVLQFTHRVLAALLGVGVLAYGHVLWREKSLSPLLRWSSVLLVALIVLQITLGAYVIWTGRGVVVTTGHVVVGALTLAVTFLVTFFIHRDTVETSAQSKV